MAEEPSTEDRLRILEQLLFLILTNFRGRESPDFRELRDLLVPTDRYDGFVPGLGPRGGLELRRSHETREDLDAVPKIEGRISALEQQLREFFKQLEILRADLGEQEARSEDLRQQLMYVLERMTALHSDDIELLSVLSDSDALAEERFRRVVPGSFYASVEDPKVTDAIEKAATDIASAVGFSVFDDQGAQSGSWIRKLLFRANEGLARPDVQDRLTKIERVLELKHLDSPQSKVDLDLSKAAVSLRKTLEGVPEGVISIGSLFAVMQTIDGKPKLAILSLTQEQMQLVKFNPQTRTDPAEFHAIIAAHGAHPMKASHRAVDEFSTHVLKAPPARALPRRSTPKGKRRKSNKDTEGKTL